jgi:hypothetical protein
MLQAAPPPLRESPPVVRLPGVTHGIDVAEVKRAGQRQPRAEGQLGPPQCHRRAERRPPTEPSGASPRPGVAARNGVPATLRVAEAAGVLGKLPAQPADAACRTPSPPCRTLLTPAAGRGPQAGNVALPPQEDRNATLPGQQPRCRQTGPCHEPARRGTRRCGAGRCGAALDGGALDRAARHWTARRWTARRGTGRRGAGRHGAADPVSRSDRHPKRQLRWKWQEERPW